MKHLYLAADENKLKDLREYTQQILPLFEKYLLYLKDNYQVIDLPRAIVWTDYETEIFRNQPMVRIWCISGMLIGEVFL